MAFALLVFQILAVWLITDFPPGMFYWCEDAYGDPFWPIVGEHVTRPNILHHYAPSAILATSWIVSSRPLLAIGCIIAFLAWIAGVVTWMLVLSLCLIVNMNQIHEWSHGSPRENPRLIGVFQRAGLLQTPAHHRRHHIHARNTHDCILTNFVNPVLNTLLFWEGLEWGIAHLFGVHRRDDA